MADLRDATTCQWARSVRDKIKKTMFSCLALGALSCSEPTQMLMVLQTDVPCSEVQSFAYAIAAPDEISTAMALKRIDKNSSNFSCLNGVLGTVGIVPTKKPGQEVAILASLRFNDSVADETLGQACIEGAAGCIWQQFRLSYVAGRKLQVVVPLNRSCEAVRCGSGLSCFTERNCQANRFEPTCSASQCELLTSNASGPRFPVDAGSLRADDGGFDAGSVDAGSVDAGTECSRCDAGQCKIECLKTDFGRDWPTVLNDTNGGTYNGGAVFVDGGQAFVLRTRPEEENYFESQELFALEDSSVSVDLLRNEIRNGLYSGTFLRMQRVGSKAEVTVSINPEGILDAIYRVGNATSFKSAGSIQGPKSAPLRLRLRVRANVVYFEAFFANVWHLVASISNPTGEPLRDMHFAIGNACFAVPLPDGGSNCAINLSVFDNVNLP
jgi:hypothetical protein